MRFIIAVIDSKSRSASGDEMAAIDEFNDKLQANGHWIIACGIDDPEKAVVLDNRNDLGFVAEGPLHSTDEFMAGFWLIHAENIEEAKALAAEGSKACNRKVEVRPILGG
jgi:hypothetical protein